MVEGSTPTHFGGTYQSQGSMIVGSELNTGGGNIYINSKELHPSFFASPAVTYETWKNINPEPVENTCKWFLNHPIFQKWKFSQRHDLLWLTADPGCGKSVLVRALVDKKWVGASSSPTICYFFFKDNELQSSLTTAMCAILHQLFSCHPNLMENHVAHSFSKNGVAMKNEFEELWRIFVAAATDDSVGEVICLFDALDEFPRTDRERLIEKVVQFYQTQETRNTTHLKFMLTSRPYPEIERQVHRYLTDVPTIRLAGEDETGLISEEIIKVIQAQVAAISREKALSPEVEAALLRRLYVTPNRTYLWLHLTLHEVRESLGHTKQKLLKVIDKLPESVEQAYENILQRSRHKEHAMNLLQIIIAAGRPLTLSEIDVALEIEPGTTSFGELELEGPEGRKEWIRECCGLFVTIFENTVTLIHETAQEFLIGNKNDDVCGPCNLQQGWKHSIQVTQAHAILAEKCITCLHLTEIQKFNPVDELFPLDRLERDFKMMAEKHSFFQYTAEYWLHHLRESRLTDVTWLKKVSDLLDFEGGSTLVWLGLPFWADGIQIFLRFVTPGRVSVPKPGVEDRGVGKRRKEILIRAMILSLPEVVEFLLKGYDPSVTDYEDALITAAETTENKRELIAILLKHLSEHGQHFGKGAISFRPYDFDILSLLLEQPLIKICVSEGLVRNVERMGIPGNVSMYFLLKHAGDQVHFTDSALFAIVRSFKKEIVSLLLQNLGDKVDLIALISVAQGNWIDRDGVIRVLIKEGNERMLWTDAVIAQFAMSYDTGPMSAFLATNSICSDLTLKLLTIATSRRNEALVDVLLDEQTPKVKVTKAMINMAERTQFYMTSVFLRRYLQQCSFTESKISSPNSRLMRWEIQSADLAAAKDILESLELIGFRWCTSTLACFGSRAKPYFIYCGHEEMSVNSELAIRDLAVRYGGPGYGRFPIKHR